MSSKHKPVRFKIWIGCAILLAALTGCGSVTGSQNETNVTFEIPEEPIPEEELPEVEVQEVKIPEESTPEAEVPEAEAPEEPAAEEEEAPEEQEEAEAPENTTATAATATEPAPSSPSTSTRTLNYIDAWDEWHVMQVREDWPACPYDWQYLTHTKRGAPALYEGDARYTVLQGVDVSEHNGSIDWAALKEQGIDFAFIRVAYRGYGQAGNLCRDQRAPENLANARAAGLKVGVYVFSQAITTEEAVQEAELILTILSECGITQLDLPVIFDPEHIRDATARTDDVSGAQFNANARAFADRIRAGGFAPGIYCNMIWQSEMLDLGMLSDLPIWFADYEAVPQSPYHFTYWQYTESATLRGIDGTVDRNLWFIPQ